VVKLLNKLTIEFTKSRPCHAAFRKHIDPNHLVSGNVEYLNEGILTNLNSDPFVINLLSVHDPHSYFSAIQSHLTKWFPVLYLRKLSDWAYEDGYRWIYLSTNLEPVDVHFEDALEAVVIGERVPEAYTEWIRARCPSLHHDVQQYITDSRKTPACIFGWNTRRTSIDPPVHVETKLDFCPMVSNRYELCRAPRTSRTTVRHTHGFSLDMPAFGSCQARVSSPF